MLLNRGVWSSIGQCSLTLAALTLVRAHGTPPTPVSALVTKGNAFPLLYPPPMFANPSYFSTPIVSKQQQQQSVSLNTLQLLKAPVINGSSMEPSSSSAPMFPIQQELSRLKNRFDKLHQSIAYQSLNELISDIFPKPLPFTQILTNSSYLEQLLVEKVKLPRKVHILFGQIVNNSLMDNIERQITPDLQLTTDLLRPLIKGTQKLMQPKKKLNISASLVNLISRCYEPYGCFSINEPFRSIYRPINLLPEPPENVRVSFHLRTRDNPTVAEIMAHNEVSSLITSTNFDANKDLKIIVHGYLENGDVGWTKVGDAFVRPQLNLFSLNARK